LHAKKFEQRLPPYINYKMANIPNDWLCPISLSIMKDPVIAQDGHTYEREAITQWFATNDRSPKTNEPLSSTALIANIALRNTIQEFFAANPQALTSVAAPLFTPSPLTTTITKKGSTIHVSVSAPSTGKRQPIVLIAIVDNSGSMGEVADADAAESFGYTRMDLVKHTIKTMAAVLGPDDMLGIVTYSTMAKVVCKPTQMTEEGRARIHKCLETIHPDSQTNIYDGIRQAAALASAPELAGRNIAALLLTDGFPNVNPPRGIVPTLRQMELKNRWTLHTFGFGYNLDSALLSEIAEWGGGLFGFIPDCSMVATIFINFLATMLSTAALNETIQCGSNTLQTGPIQYGQSRDFILSVDDVDATEVDRLDGFAESLSIYIGGIKKALTLAKKLKHQDAVATLRDAATSIIGLGNVKAQEFVRDLQGEDPEGQVGMAPEQKFFAKWGEHYLRSYLRAQELQQCMNFKDPGLQVYGGELFREIQLLADKAFDALPAPIPSGKPPQPVSHVFGGVPLTSPRSLTQSFNNPTGGCFQGDCKVLMADGSRRPIKNTNPGEMVWTPSGPSQILVVLTCSTKNKSQPMSQINSLLITPWHPILQGGKWIFPADLAFYSERMIQTVYNLVLDSGHIIDIEGIKACTLAHGFEEPVVQHPYFGTAAVIDDLKKVPGWDIGRPTFTNLVTVRDKVTGVVSGWVDLI